MWEHTTFLALLGCGGASGRKAKILSQHSLSTALLKSNQDFFLFGLQHWQSSEDTAVLRSKVPFRDIWTKLLCSTQGNSLSKAKCYLIPSHFCAHSLVWSSCSQILILWGWGLDCFKPVSLLKQRKMCNWTCRCLEEYCVLAGSCESPIHVDGETVTAFSWFLAVFN